MFIELKKKVLLACFLVSLFPFNTSVAQNCDPGADGITPVGGGITQLANGQVCANKMDLVDQATMHILYTNVDDGGDPNNVEFFIDWDDGTTQTLFFPADISQPAFPANSYEATLTHLFPAAGGNVQCEYAPLVYLQFNGTPCLSSEDSPPPFVRWNTDDQLTGVHLLAEEITSVVTFPVCAGESFPVRFSDQSTFNCVPPAYLNLINNRSRWTQFIYGTNNTITSATGVQVNGIVETYPFVGVVDTDPTPVVAPFATTLNVTVPADAQVGEEFEITMNSWNFCNRFDMGEPPVVITARILIIASPPPPVVPPTDFCVGAPVSVTVGGTGGTFDWYTDIGLTNNVFTGNPFDPTADPPAPVDRLDNSFQNSRTYYVTETLGNNCVGPASTVTFNIFDNPTPSAAGPDFSICAATSQLAGNAPAIGTGFWTSGGPGNVVAGQETLNNANVENLVAGTTTTFTWTITNGGICVSANSVDVTRDELPSPADAGPDISLCIGTIAVLNATPPAIGIGTWTITGGPGAIAPIDINNPTATITGLIPGMVTDLEWEVNNLSCTPPAIAPNIDPMQIISFLDPPADAGPDVDVCVANAFLDAAVPPVGGGVWVITAPAVTTEVIVDPVDPKTEVTGLILGTTYTLSWTVTNGVCVDTDFMTLTRSLPPDPSAAGPDQAVCSSSATLAANIPVSGTGLWTVFAGTGTFTDDTDPGTIVTGVGLAANTFRWTINNACGSNFDDVIITNDNPTAAIAGPDQNICGTGTFLSANLPAIGTGLWTEFIGDGAGVFVNDTDPTTVFNGTVEMTYTLRWTISNGVCPDTMDDVIIEFDAVPTPAIAGLPQTICGTSAVLAGNIPVIGTGQWTETIGDGLGSFVADTNPGTTFNGTVAVTYTLTWTISNGACLPSSDIVNIQFDENPTPANAGSDQVVCGNNTNLAATPLTVGTGQWLEIAGDGSGAYFDSTSPTTLFSGTSGVIYTLRWTTSNGICPSTFDDVIIQFDVNPTIAFAGGDQTLCANSVVLAANNPVIGSGLWTELIGDGLGSFLLGSDPATTFTGTAGIVYTLRWSILNGVCPVSEDDAIIQFDASPDASVAGPPQIVCDVFTTLAANTPVVGTGQWTEILGDGLGIFTSSGDPTTVFSGTGGAAYTLRWTISNGICIDSQDDVVIQFDQNPTVSNAGPDVLICGTSTNLAGNNPTIGTGLWTFVSNPDGLGNLTIPAIFNSGLSGTEGVNYTLRWTITNGVVCIPSFDDVTVGFAPPLPLTTINGDIEACIGDVKTYTIPGGDPANYIYTWDISGLPPSTTVVAGSGTPFQFISLEYFDPVVGGVLAVTTQDKVSLCISPPETLGITIYETPVMILVSSDPDGIICENESVTFTATDLLGIAITFDFKLNGSTVQSGPSNVFTTIALPTINSVTVTGIAPGGNCPGLSAPPLVHIVNPPPGIFNVSGGGQYCAGGIGVLIGLDGSEPGISYELYLNGNPTGVMSSPGGGAFSFPVQTLAGTYTVSATTASNCSLFMGGNTTISIDPLPAIFNVSGGGDFCLGGLGVSVGLDNSEVGINYQLYRNGLPQGAALPGSALPLDFGLQAISGNYDVLATNPVTFCSQNMAGPVIVNGIPVPDVVVTNNSTNICSGESTDINISGSVPGSTFTWTVTVSDASLTGVSDQLNPQPIGTIISQILSNNGTSLQTAFYEITPTGPAPTFCPGNSLVVDVIVHPNPTATIDGSASICSGSSAPITFEITGQVPFNLVYSDGTTNTTLNGIANSHILNVSPTESTDYSIVSVTDANGCTQTNPGGIVTVIVEKAVADFTTEQELEGCGPYEITFTNNNILPGVSYEWSWGDGSVNTITSDQNVNHTFSNASTTSEVSLNVTLTATNDALGCESFSTNQVILFPAVNIDIDPTANEGCSPVNVGFVNNSQGVSSHKWFYREKGTSQENEVSTDPFVSYQIQNTTSTSLVYEVVYEASNGNCSESIITEVVVLPELAPSFEVMNNPVSILDSPHATVENTTPIKNAWEYIWEWGDGNTTSAVDPGSHTYVNSFGDLTYGAYEIKQNIYYEDENGKCEATASMIFNVVPVVPKVDFEGDILEGCRPLTVNFTNLSVAIDEESVSWEIINSKGKIEGASSLYNTDFTFYDAGDYTIRLSASNSIGAIETETKEFYVTVYDIPDADFDVRPDKVFLPDGVVFTRNYSSPESDEFFWVFNLQDYNDNEGLEAGLISTEYEPEVQYEVPGFKDVMLISTISSTGCTDTLIVEKAVFVDQGGNARIPNAFTPNKNGPGAGLGGGGSNGSGGFNEVFIPVVQGLSDEPGSFHMFIFDRWGNLQFESWSRENGWDGYSKNGRLLPLGVYVYKLELRFQDGTTGFRIGDVTLIR